MLNSPAWCILSRAARQILDYCEIKLAHRWEQNSQLIMTYDELVAYGLHRNAVAPAIRELIALGFLEVTEQGRAGNAEFRRPTKVRVTYLKTRDAPPTHEWRHITEDDVAMIATGARRPGSNSAAPKKQKSSIGKRTDFSIGKRTETQDGKRTERVEKRTENFSTETDTTLSIYSAEGAVPPTPPPGPSQPPSPSGRGPPSTIIPTCPNTFAARQPTGGGDDGGVCGAPTPSKMERAS